MKQFGLLGHPLGHSMSPPIHQRLFQLSGREGEYRLYDLPPEELEGFLPSLRELRGFNVTIPYKVEMLPRMTALDDTARRYGAVNVVDRAPDGGWVGHNTDCYGFRKSIQEMGADLSQGACILGAGGVGRMFAIETALCGGAVTLAVRPSGLEKARRVQAEIRERDPSARVRIVAMDRLAGLDEPFHLLINATPVGMYPKAEASPAPAELLPRCAFVFDAIYNPIETRLVREARAAGCRAEGGMAMLVWQAVRAQEIWNGASFDPKEIGRLIREMEAAVDRQFPH